MTNICVIGAGHVGLVTTAGFAELPWYRREKEPQYGAGLGFTCQGVGSGIWSHVDGFLGNRDKRQNHFAAPKRENSYRVLTPHIHLSYQTEDRMIPVTIAINTTREQRRAGPVSEISFTSRRE